MKKKSAIIAQSVIAATVATSVVAVANPASAATTSNAEKAVVKAEGLAKALKWETSVELRKTKYPKNVVGLPNMKLFNDTKKALADAKKTVSVLKGKEKQVLSARLDANVALYVNRAVAYIDAVNSGLAILKKSNELQVNYGNGIVNDQTEKLYHELSAALKKNSYMLDRVYGQTTRDAFRTYYKGAASKQLADLLYPVTIKIEIDRANAALKAGNLQEAATRLGNVNYFVKEAAKVGQSATNKLIVGAQAKLNAAQSDFNNKAVLYIAQTTNANAPTTFGPASGTASVQKTVYAYVGLNEQLTLQNTNVDGNLVILGSPAGAGTVHLNNVKVTNGNIVVENIAEHSLYLNNVQADGIVVNDTDSFHIVAEQGTQVNNLTLSNQAGAKGTGSIESQQAGAFGSVTIASKGASTEISGDFSQTNVTVAGEGSNLAINGQGTQVQSLNFRTAAQVTVSQGAAVGEVTKSTNVSGDVQIDNKGTIGKADSNIGVGGNKPVETTTPTADAALVSFNALLKSGSVAGSSLSGVADTDTFTGVQFTTTNATKVKFTSLTISGKADNLISSPIEFNITGDSTTLTTQQLFGALDTGAPGINVGALRAYLGTLGGNTLVLKGTLSDAKGNAGSEIAITINVAK